MNQNFETASYAARTKCPKEAILKKRLGSSTELSIQIAIIAKELMGNKFRAGGDVDKIIDLVNNRFKLVEFPVEFQKDFLSESLGKLLSRYHNYCINSPRKTIKEDVFEQVLVQDIPFNVHFDSVEQEGDDYFFIVKKYSKPRLSNLGRSEETRTRDNFDLAVNQLAANQIMLKEFYRGTATVQIHHLKGRSELSTNRYHCYEQKQGENIVSWRFDGDDLNRVLNRDIPDLEYKECQDKTACANCLMNDFCHDEFVPVEKETEKTEKSDEHVEPPSEITPTDEQQDIIDFAKGEARSNAVAGSGKTTTISQNIQKRIEEGVSPEEILALTFTDKAKDELVERVARFVSHEVASNVVIETYNSFGQKLIEENSSLLGFSKKPILIDDIMKNDIIIKLLDDYVKILPLNFMNPLDSSYKSKGAIVVVKEIVDMFKANNIQTLEEAENQITAMGPEFAQDYLDIYNKYNKYLLDENLVDFEDQLRLLKQLSNKGVFSQFPYKHLIVDEFQDSNANQINMICQIYEEASFKSLLVVGDVMQAIYSFRNATPDNLINLNQYFPNIIDLPLSDNFRSETPIISMANNIIRNISSNSGQIIARKTASNIPPKQVIIEDAETEANLYARQINKLVKTQNMPLNDIAILARSKKELLDIQEVLINNGINAVLKVPKLINESPFVKAIISFASYLEDSRNTLDLAYYCKSVGIECITQEDLNFNGCLIKQSFSHAKTEDEKILLFFSMISHCEKDYIGDHFINMLHEKTPKTLDELCVFCKKYQNYKPKDSISAAREKVDAVTLITVHSSTGLDWDTVLLSGKKFRRGDEETRLLYVGITRAKRQLLITYEAKQKYMFDGLLSP